MTLDQCKPILYFFEGPRVGDIVDKDEACDFLEVLGVQGAEPFLPCRVTNRLHDFDTP